MCVDLCERNIIGKGMAGCWQKELLKLEIFMYNNRKG